MDVNETIAIASKKSNEGKSVSSGIFNEIPLENRGTI